MRAVILVHTHGSHFNIIISSWHDTYAAWLVYTPCDAAYTPDGVKSTQGGAVHAPNGVAARPSGAARRTDGPCAELIASYALTGSCNVPTTVLE